MTPNLSRRQFLGATACAFAIAGLPCNIPTAQKIEAKPLLTGDYRLTVESVDYGVGDSRTIIMRFVSCETSKRIATIDNDGRFYLTSKQGG